MNDDKLFWLDAEGQKIDRDRERFSTVVISHGEKVINFLLPPNLYALFLKFVAFYFQNQTLFVK